MSLKSLSNNPQTLSEHLLAVNVSALEEGLALLSLLTPNQYTQGYEPAFRSTIGAHFRHLLEHHRCFVSQWPTGHICYDNRERDQPLESDFVYAQETVRALILDLQSLFTQNLNQSCTLIDQQSSGPVATSVCRELLFLQSHTTHHYAIIGAMTRALGAKPAADFGVAIATRTHLQASASATSSVRGE